jgi:hypothetical protein
VRPVVTSSKPASYLDVFRAADQSSAAVLGANTALGVSRFDQLVAATEELIDQNERVRANFALFEATLRQDLANRIPINGCRFAVSGICSPPPLFEDFGALTPILQDLSDVSKTLLISASIVYNILTCDGQNLLHHRQNEGCGIIGPRSISQAKNFAGLSFRVYQFNKCAHALFLGSICFTTACDCRMRGHVRLRREGSVPHIAA